mmetsp:Transcript_42256/g.64785  ORF Transcript_42256/g.64785 Transcript_42256/m.64785 type:complete len:111 (-) Transcript_42256:5-337(-)
MLGNMAGTLPSFDLMENPKYKRINKLLFVMNETFGFNQELNGLIRHSITEANQLLAKRSIELKRMFEAPTATQDFVDDSIKSMEPLNQPSQNAYSRDEFFEGEFPKKSSD